MKLYLVRHGDAVSAEDWRGAEAQRPLTNAGRDVTRQMGRWLCDLGVEGDVVLTSPFARAVETARIIAEELDASTRILEEPLLQPGFDLPKLRTLLERHAQTRELVLVGHEPDFHTVISHLIGGGHVDMQRSGVALVDVPDPDLPVGELTALVPPAVFFG